MYGLVSGLRSLTAGFREYNVLSRWTYTSNLHMPIANLDFGYVHPTFPQVGWRLNSLETPTFSIFRLLKTMVSHHFYHEISSFTLAWCSFHRCKPQGRGFALGKLGPMEVGVAQTIGVFVLWMVSNMANSCQFRAWQISICRILSFCSGGGLILFIFFPWIS
jgi:hypothetical protein